MAGQRRAGSRKSKKRRDSTGPLITTPASAPKRSDIGRGRRKRRRRLRAAVIILVIAVVAGVVALLLKTATKKDADKPPTASRTQRTLLFQIAASDGSAKQSALIAADPGKTAAGVVFLPGKLILDIPGLGPGTFDAALRQGGAAAAKRGVSNLLGVTVDNTWTVPNGALAALIDGIDPAGLDVDVDTDVLTPLSGGGSRIDIRAGQQRLRGVKAVQFAGYVAPTETELDAFPRLQAVLEALLPKLPPASELGGKLGALGPDFTATLKAPDLAGFLVTLKDAAAKGGESFSADTLPTLPNDTGGPLTYRLDEEEAPTLINGVLASSVLPRVGAANRVILLNGNGRVGQTASATDKLRGFTVVRSGNAKNFGFKKSLVLVGDATDASLELGGKVANLLGLPASAVRTQQILQSVADVTVVLGADYKP
jgi:hypothetical protein